MGTASEYGAYTETFNDWCLDKFGARWPFWAALFSTFALVLL